MKILRHYTKVMLHWLKIILIGTVICSITTFGISKYVIKPTYLATSLIQVNGGSDVFNNQALAVSDSLLVTSSDVLRGVAQKLPGVDLDQLESTVSASPQAGSQIIEVRAEAENPQLAANIANTVVSVFIQLQVGKNIAALAQQDAQIAQNLLTAKAAVDQAQQQLTNLQKSGATPELIASQTNLLATYQDNYNTLLKNQQQVEAQENNDKGAFVIAQKAIPPSQISSPHILLNTIIAATMGLLLMIVLAILLDWLDVSIQTPEDVINLAQLEPLGSVPFSTHPLLFTNGAASSEASDERIEQAFTVMAISTNLGILNKGQRLVLVTGLRETAGVTTTAINLAIALARLGRRVLLVDTNLRQPSLHKIFHCSHTRGLAESLANIHQFHSEMIPSVLNFWRTNIPNLWLLPVTAETTYFPMTQHLREMRILTGHLLGEDRAGAVSSEAIDVIIFDAPALGKGVDAIALASLTDCSVLVVEAGKERNEMLGQAGAVLRRLGSPVLGVVVNRQTAKHRPYFYTGERSQKTTLAGNLSLEEATEALLTKLTVLPDTPPSLPQANQQNGLARSAQSPANGSNDGPPTERLSSSSYKLRRQNLQGGMNPRLQSWKPYSSENPK